MSKNPHTKKPRLPMRWLLLVGVVLFIYVAISIPQAIIDHQRNQRQILFEVWRFRGGLGPPGERGTWGIYIDSLGDVYYFNGTHQKDDTVWEDIHRFLRSDLRGQPPYTTSQLFKHYRNTSEYFRTIPTVELEYLTELLEASQFGEMEYCDHYSRDWGLYSFDGFIYNPKWKTHEPITLGYWGDFCGYNSTDEAKVLVETLSDLFSEIMTEQGQSGGWIIWN